VGRKLGLHSGSVGKVLLAHLTPGELKRFLESELAPYTPNTITDPDVLREQVRRIAEQGYAISISETGMGIAGICVPIYSPSNRFVGGLNLAGPSARLDEDDLLSYLDLLREKAREISARMRAP
jgi:IclR family acetate operon transcriptional repressor